MLSRVAERMYWFGRQVERIENTARLVNVNANLVLDLPKMAGQIWAGLIEITGSHNPFYDRYTRADERNVSRYMITEASNPDSLLSCISMARENARVSREIMPTESWGIINELYLYLKKNSNLGTTREGRYKFLHEIIKYCNQLTGQLIGGMSQDSAYSFIRLGRNMERADMSTRIVDVGCLNLLRKTGDVPGAFDDLLWMNVLRSLSAYQMYRQHVKYRVNGEDVVSFLLKDNDFPRSIGACLSVINYSFTILPGNDAALRAVTHIQRMVNEVDVAKLLEQGLHEFIDEIQIKLAELHTSIELTWFGREYVNTVESGK